MYNNISISLYSATSNSQSVKVPLLCWVWKIGVGYEDSFPHDKINIHKIREWRENIINTCVTVSWLRSRNDVSADVVAAVGSAASASPAPAFTPTSLSREEHWNNKYQYALLLLWNSGTKEICRFCILRIWKHVAKVATCIVWIANRPCVKWDIVSLNVVSTHHSLLTTN